jgi:Bifunctional DNA primase/polymerase, N-terminal
VSGVFSEWQPKYAARGVATFPIKIEGKRKVPMTTNYQHVGLRASCELAQKFRDADAFGCVLGERSKIMVVDVDTKDLQAVDACQSQHGETPIVTQTASKAVSIAGMATARKLGNITSVRAAKLGPIRPNLSTISPAAPLFFRRAWRHWASINSSVAALMMFRRCRCSRE